MAKEFIGQKIIITLDANGDFDSGILIYRIKTDGVLGKEQKSIAIKNMAFSKLNLAKIINTITDKTKEQEGISNG